MLVVASSKLAKCPGEDRSKDGTCTVDGGFVCLQLLDTSGRPRDFAPAQDWWDITGQAAKWDDRIRGNGGDSWCVCATCASEIVEKVGCAKMPIRCNATNEEDVFGINLPQYHALDWKGWADQAIGRREKCLRQKCGFKAADLWDASLEALQKHLQGGSWVQSTVVLSAALGVAAAVVLLLRRLFAFGRSGSHAMPINVYAEAEQKLGSSSSRLRAATDCTMPINIVAEIPKQTLSPKAALRPCQSEPRLRPSSARLQVEQPTVMRHNRKMKRTATLDNKVRRLLEDDELELCKEAPHPAAREADLTVASLCGRVSEKDRYQPYFSGKRMDFSQLGQFEALPHKLGVHCQRGHKPDSPNQDDFFVLQTNTWLFCGVADGHGENGHKVSHFVQEQLPQAVLQRLKTENFTNWRTTPALSRRQVPAFLLKKMR
eukprot:g31336.t1